MANNNINYAEKINKIMDEMPEFVADFIYNYGKTNNYMTKHEYARDIRDFFQYMVSFIPQHKGKLIKELSIDDVGNVEPLDINRYITLLGADEETGLKDTTLKKRRASLSSMYSFYVNSGKMNRNPVSLTNTIKIPDKELIYLTNEEQDILLESVRYGTGLSDEAAKKHNKYAERDSALFLLLLDTGLRVSEALSTDICDYDLMECSVIVKRKGGDIDTVYYSDECAENLSVYFSAQRNKFLLEDTYIPAFTTVTGKRLGVRAVETLVKKYVAACLPHKAKIISPHKLRSSFAMSFYEASDNNILLLKKRMHHKSITTTNIYAQASNKDVQSSRNLIKRHTKLEKK